MFRSPRLLIAARVLGGMTQSELAAAAGVGLSVLQAIEQGRSDPRLSTTLALLDALEAHGVHLVPASKDAAYGLVVTPGSRAEDAGKARASESASSEPDETAQPASGPVAKRIGRGQPRKQTGK